jgi:hypothetical protein
VSSLPIAELTSTPVEAGQHQETLPRGLVGHPGHVGGWWNRLAKTGVKVAPVQIRPARRKEEPPVVTVTLTNACGRTRVANGVGGSFEARARLPSEARRTTARVSSGTEASSFEGGWMTAQMPAIAGISSVVAASTSRW